MKNNKFKALLLAAGFGTRLRPLTNQVPKCLVKIGKYPIIEHWLRKIEKMNIEEVLINTHYLPNKVNNYLLGRPKSKLNINVVHEEKLLGTAGTLINNQKFFKNSNILFIHADNFTLDNLGGFIDFYKRHEDNDKVLLTMLTFQTRNPKSCGIVTLDEKGFVDSFQEKVHSPKGNLANGAVYLFKDSLIDFIVQSSPNAHDFSLEIIPKLIKRIKTWQTNHEYIDIGTHQNLILAREYYQKYNT